MGQRRTKVEVLNEKISKVDSKIAAYTEKIAALEDEKTALAAQLEEIHKAAKKAEEAAELKRLLKLMHKKDISVEDLESMIFHRKLITKTGSEEFSSKPVFL